MILSSEIIKELCTNPSEGLYPLILPFDDSILKDNPAKVELRLGDYCYCSSNEREIISLKDQEKVTIKPNEIFLFQTYETINMPKNLSGRMSLKMKLVSKGLLMPCQTQVDPGYSNILFGMLYNLSSDEIELSYKQPITTLEFTQTMIDNSFKYNGTMGKLKFEEFVRNRITSSLGELAKDVDKSQKDLEKNTQKFSTIMTALSVAVGAVSLIVAASAIAGAWSKDAEVAVLEQTVSTLESTVGEQVNRLEAYEQELKHINEIIAEYEDLHISETDED